MQVIASVRRTAVVEKRAITKLTIKGFKTLQDVELELGKLNVLIGPNGAGKSNLVSYFQMLIEMLGGRLQVWVAKRGGPNRLLTFGADRTPSLSSYVYFDDMSYQLHLAPTDANQFTIGVESFEYHDTSNHGYSYGLASGKAESQMHGNLEGNAPIPYPKIIYNSMANWRVYHFHNTGETAPLNFSGSLHVHQYLRPDGSNLAAYLYWLKHFHADTYSQVLNTVRLAVPFLADFELEPNRISVDESTIQLKWRQHDSDHPFLPSQLSDGSLRFICLVTALLQPDPPSTIIIDEPELGLHPYAITLLGALIHAASERMQIIVAAQSVSLVNQFDIENLVVVERQDGVSVFKRLDESDFELWLEDYSVGDLWEKNVLGGRLS